MLPIRLVMIEGFFRADFVHVTHGYDDASLKQCKSIMDPVHATQSSWSLSKENVRNRDRPNTHYIETYT